MSERVFVVRYRLQQPEVVCETREEAEKQCGDDPDYDIVEVAYIDAPLTPERP